MSMSLSMSEIVKDCQRLSKIVRDIQGEEDKVDDRRRGGQGEWNKDKVSDRQR